MVEGSTSPPWIFESSKKSSPGKKVVKFMVVMNSMGSQSLKKNHQKGKQIQELFLKKNWLFKNVIFMSWFMKHTPT